MAGASNIRAGGAFVELWTKDDRFRKGIADAGRRLKSLQGSVRILEIAFLGRAFRALSESIFNFTVRSFAEYGSAIADAQARTGATAETLQELQHAAEQTGATLTDVVAGFEYMSRFMSAAGQSAANGSKEALAQISKLGLEFKTLKNASPDEQFEMIAGALSQIDDQAKLTAATLQIFGKGAGNLIPLIKEFNGETRAAFHELRNVGGLLSSSDIQLADKLGDVMATLGKGFAAIKNQIGAALAPVLLGAFKALRQLMAGIAGWISENRELVAQIAAATFGVGALVAAVLGAGLAFQAMSFALGGIGKALGGLAGLLIVPFMAFIPTVLKVASGLHMVAKVAIATTKSVWLLGKAITGVALGGKILALLVNPWFLMVAAIGAAIAAAVYFSGTIKNLIGGAFQFMKNVAMGFFRDWGQSLKAIVNAIKSGNLEAAWEVVTTQMEVHWLQMLNVMKEAFLLWKNAIMAILQPILDGIAAAANIMPAHKRINDRLMADAKKRQQAAAAAAADAAVANDPEIKADRDKVARGKDAQKALDADTLNFIRKQKQLEQKEAGLVADQVINRDAGSRKAIERLEKDKAVVQAAVKERQELLTQLRNAIDAAETRIRVKEKKIRDSLAEKANRPDDEAGQVNDMLKQVQDAQKRLDAARKRAKDLGMLGDKEKNKDKLAQAEEGKVSVAGTFNPYAVQGIGGQSLGSVIRQEAAKGAERDRRKIALLEKIARQGPAGAFGP